MTTDTRDPAFDAVVLSSWTWETWNVMERLASGLSERGSVLYADRPRGYSRARERASRTPEQIGPQLSRLRPAVLTVRAARAAPLRRRMARSLASDLVAAADSSGLTDPIFFVHHTPLPEIVDAVPWFSVLVVMDWTPPGRARELELELAVRADLILAIPHSVYHRFKAMHPEKTELIPTSCDARQLEQALAGVEEPPELLGVRTPRILYGGRAGQTINADLFLGIARKRPDWSLVIVGGADDARLSRVPNIHVVPPQRRDRMASFLGHVDVGLLPYDLGKEQMQHCLPLKFFEYLAAGLPVVGAPLLELERYGEYVRFGDTDDQLVGEIEAALAKPEGDAVKDARRAVARAHSVERMTERVADVIRERHLARAAKPPVDSEEPAGA